MPRFPNLSLSVILPAYNEEQLIESTVRRGTESLRRMMGAFEIVLIDDCSRDRTGEIADRLAEEIPELRVVHNETNLRQGGCLVLGFQLARCDLVMHNAADYPFDFEDLSVILPYFPAADVVVVTRKSYPGVSAARRFLSWGNRALIRSLFGLQIIDYNFVQVFKRSVLAEQSCFSDATAFITVERILRAHWTGHSVVAVEADYHRRSVGVSSSGTWRVVRDSFRDMGRLWLELRLGWKPAFLKKEVL